MNITHMKRTLYTVLGCFVFFLVAGSAHAGTCPSVDFATDCNLLITIGTGNSVTTTFPDATPYDGVEDQLVGVVNNSGATINSLTLTGSNIFGFDSDGACTLGGFSGCDSTGYGGPGVTFSIIDANNGVVNFTGGLASGSTIWFSLEEPASVNGVGITVGSTPEPGSLLLLGTGLLGLGLLVRRSL